MTAALSVCKASIKKKEENIVQPAAVLLKAQILVPGIVYYMYGLIFEWKEFRMILGLKSDC